MAKYKPIPTLYNGVQFRSRIEATWAAFFDNLGWSWEYEPCDFNGWIPDFLIEGKYFVEVKTFFIEEEWLKSEVPGDIDRAGIDGCLLCGGTPVVRNGWDKILWYEPSNTVREVLFLEADDGEVFGCDYYNDQNIRIGLRSRFKANEADIWGKWVDAKNKTQWKGRRRY